MMYRRTADFINDWTEEASATLKVFGNISNECLNKKDHENVRSIAVLTWHITTTIPEMMTKAGLSISGADEHSKPPQSIFDIMDAYKNVSDSLLSEIRSKWTDDSLTEEVPMYGETWSKGKILSVLIFHQTHHRGQLTVLMRQAGLKVPGVYGPSKEEWAQFNMPAMD